MERGRHLAYRPVSRGWVLPLALALSLVMGSVAWADTVQADADVASTSIETSLNLGTLAPGANVTVYVGFQLQCAGKNHADNGQTVTFAYSSTLSTVPAGGTMVATAGSVGPVPASWPDDTTGGGSTNCPSPVPSLISGATQRSTVTITAPLSAGSHSYVARWSSTLTPAGNGDSQAITGSDPHATFTLTVQGDTAAPQSASIVIDGGDTWTNSPAGTVSLALFATDNVGIAKYRLAETQAGLNTATDTFVSPAEATFSRPSVSFVLTGLEDAGKAVWLRVFDAAGNFADASDTIGWDKTAPSISCGAAESDWHATDVSILCTSSDVGGSGLANSADESFSLSTDVSAGTETDNAQTGSHDVYDVAGNMATAGPIGGNKVDKKAPSIDIVAPNGGPYVLGEVVNAVYSCEDGGSGVFSCSGPVVDGSAFDTSAVGAKSFVVSAEDEVGNQSSSTQAYRVEYATGNCLGAPGRQVLQPINPDGSSVFKKGSTVPVKFRVCDANGNSVGTPGVVTGFKLVKRMSGTVVSSVNEDPTSTTPDTAFRWSESDQQWIFNLNTKSLMAGYTYYYEITLNDGTKIEFAFGLR